MAATLEPMAPVAQYLDGAKLQKLRNAGDLTDNDIARVAAGSSKYVADQDIHWRKYGASNPLGADDGKGLYLVADLRGRGTPNDDSPAHCRGVIGVVIAEVDGDSDSVEYLAIRRTKLPGQDAVYTPANGRDNEPRRFKDLSDAQSVLTRQVTLAIAGQYAAHIAMEKRQQLVTEKDKSLTDTLSPSRSLGFGS